MKRLPLLLGIALLLGTFGLVGWSMMDQPSDPPPRPVVADAPEDEPPEDAPLLAEGVAMPLDLPPQLGAGRDPEEAPFLAGALKDPKPLVGAAGPPPAVGPSGHRR